MTEEYLEELIQKYADETASEEEIHQLMNWYRSFPVNDVQWPSATPGEKKKVYNKMLQRLRSGGEQKKAKILILSWQKVAAALIIIIGAAWFVLRNGNSSASPYITVINPSGKIQEVLLPDRSKVWLNATTELRYTRAFKKNREVELRGEAYFEVTHDASHPFIISGGGVQTTVLGTTFNIKAYQSDNSTTVSVISGSVQVANNSKTLAVLKPSMQLQYNKQEQKATTTTIDSNSVSAWRHGKLQFEGESLADITKSLERWYGIKIVFTNTEMKNCRYYMGFDNQTPLEELLSTMAELTKMQYTINKNDNSVTLSGKECE
jgi:ferric-dicitrate binding protein FerR (iron transport regulator)